MCGKETLSLNYLRNVKYTCTDCKLEKKLSDKTKRKDDNFEIKEKKFNNAVTRLKKLNIRFNKYETAINKVHSKLHNIGWFDSTEEILAAIELEKNNIKYRHQVKFGGRYKADFVLDDEKIVLEIDGKIFHTKDTLDKENVRDDLIVLTLGVDWEVIRISDELINQNITKLIPAMRRVQNKRKELRLLNNECLPNWYSDKN